MGEKITTIQVRESTRKRLASRKRHGRESYDSVLSRLLEEEGLPSIEEMFAECDETPQDRYTTKEILEMTHELR